MVSQFFNLQATNSGGTKTVSVTAVADANGASGETITFVIIDQTKTASVTIPAKTGQVVSVDHTASGSGMVTVTNGNGSAALPQFLNVDGEVGAGI
jgi:hypothetical protein